MAGSFVLVFIGIMALVSISTVESAPDEVPEGSVDKMETPAAGARFKRQMDSHEYFYEMGLQHGMRGYGDRRGRVVGAIPSLWYGIFGGGPGHGQGEGAIPSLYHGIVGGGPDGEEGYSCNCCGRGRSLRRGRQAGCCGAKCFGKK